MADRLPVTKGDSWNSLHTVIVDHYHLPYKLNSRNGALPGPFSSPFGFEEVLELETLIFKLEKTIIAHFKDLDKPIKMASLNLKGYFLF